MEPIIAGLFKTIGRILAEGGGEVKVLFEALGAISLVEWMSSHLMITLGACAVALWGVVGAASKK
jgi:hypothetical protein